MISSFSLGIIGISFIILLTIFLLSYWFNGPKTSLSKNLRGKIILITGGLKGIGFEVTKELLNKNAKVIILSKDKKNSMKKINSINLNNKIIRCFFHEVDLRNYNSIINFVKEFKENIGFVDILINNAGSVFYDFNLINGIEETLLNNFIGHLILTSLLIDCFNPKGIIMNITSSNYKLISKNNLFNFIATNNLNFEKTKENYNWCEIYNISKLCNIYNTIYLKDYIIKNGLEIKIISIHPGFINNTFYQNIIKNSWYFWFINIILFPIKILFFKSNFMGAQTILNCCFIDYEDLINGGYYKDCHSEKLEKIANLIYARKIMEFTHNIIVRNNFVNNNLNVLKIFT